MYLRTKFLVFSIILTSLRQRVISLPKNKPHKKPTQITINVSKVTKSQNQSQKPTLIKRNSGTNSLPSLLNVAGCQNLHIFWFLSFVCFCNIDLLHQRCFPLNIEKFFIAEAPSFICALQRNYSDRFLKIQKSSCNEGPGLQHYKKFKFIDIVF